MIFYEFFSVPKIFGRISALDEVSFNFVRLFYECKTPFGISKKFLRYYVEVIYFEMKFWKNLNKPRLLKIEEKKIINQIIFFISSSNRIGSNFCCFWLVDLLYLSPFSWCR